MIRTEADRRATMKYPHLHIRKTDDMEWTLFLQSHYSDGDTAWRVMFEADSFEACRHQTVRLTKNRLKKTLRRPRNR